MRIFSAEYFASLAGVALVSGGMVALARLRPGGWTHSFSRVLAVLLLVNQASWYVVERTSLSMQWSLPLGLCEVGTLVAAAALWWRQPLLVELTYFWGLGGTRTAAVTVSYMVVVAGIDRLTRGDYLYLASRPPTFSVLNWLGPWPWYIAGMTVLGIAVLVILDLPLRAARSHVADAATTADPDGASRASVW